MKRRVGSAAALVAPALVAGACGSPAPPSLPGWCTANADARVVLAPAEPRTLRLTEVWRRGGRREEEVLAFPWPPAVGARGWIAIPDVWLRAVVVLDTLGTWIGPVTDGGGGPGEVTLPAAAVWEADDRLAILDVGDASIVRLRAPGFELIEDVRVTGRSIGEAAASGEVLSLFLDQRGRTGIELRGVRTPGEVAVRALQAVESPDGDVDTLIVVETAALSPDTRWGSMLAPGHPVPVAAAGPGGRIALAGDVPRYRIRILGAELSDSLVICRDVAAEPLSASERGDTAAPDGLLIEALRAAPRPPAPQSIGRLFFGSAGELWVQRTRPNPFRPGTPPEGAEYDQFSPDGLYRGSVTAPVGTVLHAQVGDLVIAYERGELDEISVVGLRLASP